MQIAALSSSKFKTCLMHKIAHIHTYSFRNRDPVYWFPFILQTEMHVGLFHRLSVLSFCLFSRKCNRTIRGAQHRGTVHYKVEMDKNQAAAAAGKKLMNFIRLQHDLFTNAVQHLNYCSSQ